MDDKHRATEDPKITLKKNEGQTPPSITSKGVQVQPQITIHPPGAASEKKTDSDGSMNSIFAPRPDQQSMPIVSNQSTAASKQVPSKSNDNFYDVMPAKTSHNIPLDLNALTEEQLKTQIAHIDNKGSAQKTSSVSTSAQSASQLSNSLNRNVSKTTQLKTPKTVASKTPSSTSSQRSALRSIADRSIKCNECNCKCIIPIVTVSCKKCGCVCSSIKSLDSCSNRFTVTIKHKQTVMKFEENKTENKKQTGNEESKSTIFKKKSDGSDKSSK